jgi:hypothetical protein
MIDNQDLEKAFCLPLCNISDLWALQALLLSTTAIGQMRHRTLGISEASVRGELLSYLFGNSWAKYCALNASPTLYFIEIELF